MIAAIYARKSTSQDGVAEDAKSVTRQVDHARAYAARQGWTVDERHIYIDDGISGAEFANRPGYMALMQAVKPTPPFDVLIMSEDSRLGRESIETAYALKQLIAAGVRVWCYLEDRERTLDSPTDKILLSISAYAAEMEREQTRQRVIDTMKRRVQAGHATGGGCFGYDNVRMPEGHVVQRVNETEAAVVRRIFELAAGGMGMSAIARRLNAERQPAPRAQQDRPHGWAPSSVREVLHRDRYRGVLVWNKTRLRDKWGARKQRPRPQSEWLSRPTPELRIISDDLWAEVHTRIATRREATSIRASSGPRKERYLLPGFVRCAVCGSGMHVRTKQRPSGVQASYACTGHYARGLCTNRTQVPVARLDAAILHALDEVVSPALADRIVDAFRDLAAQATEARAIAEAQARVRELQREAARLADAIATAGDLAPLITRLQQTEAARQEAVAHVATLEAQAGTAVDWPRAEASLRRLLGDWRALLRLDPPAARQALRVLVEGPIRLTPIDEPTHRGYRFEGRTALGTALLGDVELRGVTLWCSRPDLSGVTPLLPAEFHGETTVPRGDPATWGRQGARQMWANRSKADPSSPP